MSKQPRKQHLIDTALRLFNEHGYHATGIDWILKESGVSKATLYKHFKSKEELILAVLKQRSRELRERIDSYVEKAEKAGDEPVLAIFDALEDWFRSPGFYGCNFIKASAEYAQPGDMIHEFAAEHKRGVRDRLKSLLKIEGKKARAALADQLALLVDGAIVCAHVRDDLNAARTARAVAERLLETHSGKNV